MTVSELFDFIKGVRPGSAFTDAQMMVWLNEIEGKVQTDILLLEPSVSEEGTTTGFIEYDATIDPETGKMADAETELIVKFPWDKLYRYFMLMSIDLYNGEYQRYANTFALFNEAYEEYSAWVAQNIAPANGNAVAHGYYLTAYQFAVNGGYTGTAHDFSVLLASYAGTAEAVRDERERAEEAAELSERWATGNAGGTPSATNNSKYYAQQARAVYGAPLTAATAAAMTDTTRVYVYTGNEDGYVFGKWYYHNGTEWTVGGVYNSIAIQTDKTLSQTDQAADAEAVGDRFDAEISRLEYSGIFLKTGTLAHNTVLFTSDDVYVGDTIKYYFTTTVPANKVAYLRCFNSDGDPMGKNYGKTTTGETAEYYSGSFKVPANFGSCKVYTGDSSNMTVVYLCKSNDARVAGLETATGTLETATAALQTDMDAVKPTVSVLTATTDRSTHYNLLGTDTTKRYPVLLENGDKITVTRSDGVKFDSDSTLVLNLYANKDDVDPKATRAIKAPAGSNPILKVTYTNNISPQTTIKYISVNEEPAAPLMITYGDVIVDYVPYRENTTEERIDDIATVMRDGGILAYGIYGRNDVLFTSDDVSAGDTISYDFMAPPGSASTDYGYLQVCNAAGTGLHNYGKTTGSGDAHQVGSFVISEDVAYCKVLVNGSNKLNIKSVIVDTGRIEGRAAAEIEREFKALKIGAKAHGTHLFTKDEVKSGDVLHYEFTLPEGTSAGYFRFLGYTQSGSTEALHFYRYEPTYSGTIPSTGYVIGRDRPGDTTHFSGAVIVPTGYEYAKVDCDEDKQIVFTKLYVDRLEHRTASADLDIPPYYFDAYDYVEDEEDESSVHFHYDSYLPDKVKEINAKLDETLAYGDAFMFVTDIHLRRSTTVHVGSDYNEFHTPALMNFIGKRTTINKAILGGDLFHNGPDEECEIARTYMNLLHEGFGRKVFHTVGNHDMFQHNTASRITTWADAMHDDFNGNSRRHYYYFDNSRAKIRYIVLATYYEADPEVQDQNYTNGFWVPQKGKPTDPDYEPAYYTEQKTWFEEVALNMPAGWGAIVFVHDICQFRYGDDKCLEPQAQGRRILDCCSTYNADPDSAGEVMAIVSGHTHCDRVLYGRCTYQVKNTQTQEYEERTIDVDVPVIITTSDQNGGLGVIPNATIHPSGLGVRESGTVREQAFDVMVIDRRPVDISGVNMGTIYAIRVGCEAYDGDDMGTSEDKCFGSATQMRTIHFPTKFDANDWA